VFNLVEKEYHHWIQHGILVQIGIVQYSVRQYWPLVAVERPNGTKRSNIFESTAPEQFRAPCLQTQKFTREYSIFTRTPS